MKITAFDDLYPGQIGIGGTTLIVSDGSNSGYSGGDVIGEPGDLSVVGLRSAVSLSSNLTGSVGDVLTLIQAAPLVAQFATPSNTGGASFGSNATRVSETASAGALTTSAREDHIHDGIGTITASSSNTMQRGTFNLRAGTGIALALSDGDGDGEFDTATIVNTVGASGGGGGGGAPTSAYYVTTAADATLSSEIVIPGLAGSTDVRVAGTNDDEFDTTDTSDPMTGWTTLGTPSAHDINSTLASHYYVKRVATSGTAWHGIYKASPSTPFTVTAKLSDVRLAADYMAAGLFIGEATPGKMDVLAMNWSGTRQVRGETFTNPTTYSSGFGTGDANQRMPLYFRIVVTSSTNIAYYVSGFGRLWFKVTDARNPGFTVGSAGLVVKAENTTHDVEAVFDWIRFT